MANKTWRERTGLTPGKTALVAVLGTVLVVVVAVQFGGSDSQQSQSAPRQRPPRRTPLAASNTRSENNAGEQSGDALPAWPISPVSQALAYNPFTPLEKNAGKQATAQATELVEPRQEGPPPAVLTQKVSFVLIAPDGPVATVGPHMLRVGDVIDGLVVTEIDEKGVVLADKKEQAGTEDGSGTRTQDGT